MHDGLDMMPVEQDGHMPMHEPIPEAVPNYNPGQPLAPNPYEMPAAPAYAETSYVPSVEQAAAEQAPAPGYDQFGRAISVPYQPPYVDPKPAYSDGNTAVDLSYNPYASGEAIAGSFDGQPTSMGNVDQYGQPISPPYQ